MKKNPIFTGALILTLTGFISRLIGFFYRIYLSNAIGAEGMGIYQMIFPVFGICISICCMSIQTAISRNVAAQVQKNPADSGTSVFKAGLLLSLSISLILAFLVHSNAAFLATHFILEPKCESLLKIMALAIPMCSVTSCINGYYYGLKKAHIPAISQLVEQIIRVLAFFIISKVWLNQGMDISVSLAVIVMVMGEAASALFSAISGGFHFAGLPKYTRVKKVIIPNMQAILFLAIPLTANRLSLSFLQSMEAILIPNKLQLFGLSNSSAYSVYGTLTGMALPFILFPSAITNSIAVMLLPAMAEAQSAHNDKKINRTASATISLSLGMGILCIALFLEFGNELGQVVFKNNMAGTYITILAWICPFLYLATTVGSILNGLGKITATFLHNLIGLLLRLTFVIILIPKLGILAYLWGMLVSELVITILHIFTLKRSADIEFHAWKDLLLPILLAILSIGASRGIQTLSLQMFTTTPISLLMLGCFVLCSVYGILYYSLRLKSIMR